MSVFFLLFARPYAKIILYATNLQIYTAAEQINAIYDTIVCDMLAPICICV